MRSMRLRHGIVVAVGASAALLAVNIAVAGIPGGDGKISGCYEKHSGLLRVIDAEAGRTCFAIERAITWSQRGPAGATGGRPASPGREEPTERSAPPDRRALPATRGWRRSHINPMGRSTSRSTS